MSELSLSSNLQVITAEINSYKQIAGQSVFEIGKRLKHVKENDLVHGQWETWLSEHVDFSRMQAHRFIEAYEQFGNVTTSLQTSKIFELLSLPESIDRNEFVDREHVVPSTGESKTVDEMTVKELREVKKALKTAEQAAAESEQRAKQAEAERQLAIQQHTEQQEKLLAQIDELKKKKAMSLEDKERLQKLTEQNFSLTRTIDQIREEYEAKVTKLENDRHSIKKLKESFKNILVTINFEHSQAEYYMLGLKGIKDAQDAVKHFVDRFEEEVLPRIEQWRRITEINLEQGGSEDVQSSSSARSGVVIDIDPEEG
ncbi:peptidase [Paenibacillus antibioticophila]|uniref:Peptidase n=1 Tax=Paenibacillus antibioticophila TaxID=1274374 RepID=A0A919XYM3_9BACL|nr:DUF3102 domain-containing protein [Paenibacillus antibioticophila]GIO39270.1 peptidase [Paenibacillus antibioticophila]